MELCDGSIQKFLKSFPTFVKWNEDKATIHFAELTDMTDFDYICAS